MNAQNHLIGMNLSQGCGRCDRGGGWMGGDTGRAALVSAGGGGLRHTPLNSVA